MPRTETLRISAGEASLVGSLTLPDAPPPAERRGRYPMVILLGSWLPRDRDGGYDRRRHPDWFAPDGRVGLLRRLAEALAEAGVVTLRYDPRGCGASDGDWVATQLFTRIDDARDALGHLRSRDDLDLARTGIVGHGEGASVAMSVAIADPAIGALTLIGGAARSFREVLRRSVAAAARRGQRADHPLLAALHRGSEELIERAERHEATMIVRIAEQPIRLDLRGWQQAFATPPFALATMMHRSVSLVHGGEDEWTHPDESRLLRDALVRGGNEPALRGIDDAGHDLAEAPDALMEELAVDLTRRLVPRTLPPVLLAIEQSGTG